ncbi:hypothetical protein ACFL50_05710 [Candidatus Latescibacterota bacterium]
MNVRYFSVFLILLITANLTFSQVIQPQTIIEIETRMSPPDWALMERELLKSSSDAVEKFAEAFLDDRGYLLHTPRWGTLDGTDDAVDTFANWTLLYSLGASGSVLELFKKAYEGHLRQYKEVKTDSTVVAKYGCYYKEFMPMSDWHHNGEGMRGFNLQGLADPTDKLLQKRYLRFAGFYMNEDPEAPNYDPELKIIKSIWNGSKGPMLRRATQYDWVGDPFTGRYHIIHSSAARSEMLDADEAYPEMLAHCAEYLHSAGDHPLNLIATNLSLNAFALTGDDKYKKWLVEYVDKWKEYTITNGGNIPTNIGLDGTIGGETDGKWYGGTYGWDFSPWSPEFKEVAHRNMFDKGMWPGFSNALMMTGDQSYIDVLRKQMDNMYAESRVTNGRLMIPHNYGEKSEKTEPPDFRMVNSELFWKEKKLTEPGWYNWTSNLMIPRLIEIYMWSMDRKDLERIPIEGWIAFLEGKDPEYPVKAMNREFTVIREKMKDIRNDYTTPDTRLADWPMDFNPYSPTLTLNRLMQGGYLTGMIWNLHCRVRYFDPVKKRAGIPDDVAALVTEMDDETVKVVLVNINQIEPCEVIVQTGGYGEHQCLQVETGDRMIPVDNRFFTVRLSPGAGAEFVIHNQRYANPPTLAFPWHNGNVPMN